MDGLLHRRIPLLARRLITAVPALIMLAAGLDPTGLLIISQVALSFGIPFALVPLVRIAGDESLMVLAPSRRLTVVLAWLVVGIVVIFNAALINGWWWWWVPPIVLVCVVFIGLFLVTVGLDEIANPRMRKQV